jgi:hypothetical protein
VTVTQRAQRARRRPHARTRVRVRPTFLEALGGLVVTVLAVLLVVLVLSTPITLTVALLALGMTITPQPVPPVDYRIDPAAFIDTFLPLNEQGRPWKLSPYQRRVLKLALTYDSGLLLTRLLLWGERKKSGKTMIAACVATWWAMTRGPCEVVCLANDLEQSQGRVFSTVVALLRANGFEKAGLAKLLSTSITCKNGSVIKAVASDYRGESGGRQTLSVFDELWGYSSERAVRLWEESMPIPTTPEGWVLVVTTAGFTGESTLLEGLYQRGIAGERLDPDLELYRTAASVTFWSQQASVITPSRRRFCGRTRSPACTETSGSPRRAALSRRTCGMAAWIAGCARSRPQISLYGSVSTWP